MDYKIFDNDGYIIDTETNDYGEQTAVVHLGSCSNGLNIARSFYFAAFNGSTDQLGNMVNRSFKMYWDFTNGNVDEICLFDYDKSYKTKEDISALTFKYDDGPLAVKHVERYESYDVSIGNDVTSMFQFNILFDPDIDSDALSFERTLLIVEGDKVLFRISFIAESEGEDERMTAICNTLNIKLPEEDCIIFKEYDMNEYRPDWNLLNKKRKELLATVSETQYYVGSFRSVINMIRFFGWDDVIIGEYWQDVNPGSDNYGHMFKVDRYDVSVRQGDPRLNKDKTRHPSRNYKKTNRSALVYKVTESNSKQDRFSDYLPYIDEVLNYPIEEVSVKLYRLKEKLNSEYMPVSNKFSDAIGECVYFTRVMLGLSHQQSRAVNVESGLKDIDFEIYPSTDLYITDDRLFFNDIYDNRKDNNEYDTDYDNYAKGYEFTDVIPEDTDENIIDLKFKSIAELMEDSGTDTLGKLIDKGVDLADTGDNTYDLYDKFRRDSNPMECEMSMKVTDAGRTWITDAMAKAPISLSLHNRKYAQAFALYCDRHGTAVYAGNDSFPFRFRQKDDYGDEIKWESKDSFDTFGLRKVGSDTPVPVSAKCILRYDMRRFDNVYNDAQFSWDECCGCQTWEHQAGNAEIANLRWTVKHDATGSVWIYGGNATVMCELFLRLPYTGSYTVMLESTNTYGVVTRKLKEGLITVKPVNIDVTGIYQIDPDADIDDDYYNAINYKETEQTGKILSDISDADIYDAIPYYYGESNDIENNKDISIAISPKHIWDNEPVIELNPYDRDTENMLLSRYMNSVYDMPVKADMMTVFPSEPACAFCPIPPVKHYGDDQDGDIETSQEIYLSSRDPSVCGVIELILESGEIAYMSLEMSDGRIDWHKTLAKLNSANGSITDSYYWSTVLIPNVISADTGEAVKYHYWMKTANGYYVKQETRYGLSCTAKYKTSKLNIKSMSIIPCEYVKYLKINGVTLSSVISNNYSIKSCKFNIDFTVKVTRDSDGSSVKDTTELYAEVKDKMKDISFTAANDFISFELRDGYDLYFNDSMATSESTVPYAWYILALHYILNYKFAYSDKGVTGTFKVNSCSVTEADSKWSVSDLNSSMSVTSDKSIFDFLPGNPNTETARLIHSHTMLYPYTWCILSVKDTKIAGIKHVKWTVTNEYTGYSTGSDSDYKALLASEDPKILPVLFKQDGRYTVSVTVTDTNDNTYTYSSKLITVKTYNNF